MNLAFIAKGLEGKGGTESDLVQLLRGLAERGHRLTVYSLKPGIPPGLSCGLVRVPVIGHGALAALWSLAVLGPRLAFGGGHDLVIGYARLLRQDVVRCGGGAHESYLASLHAAGPRWRGWLRRIQPLHRSILAIERRQYQPGRYCRVLAVSQAVKADLMRVHGVPAAAVAVIPGGVDTVRFHPRLREEHRAAVRAAYRIPSNARCLLFVGNGFRRKGLETLLRAMAVEPDPDLHALVVGTDPDAGRYRELACRLGVGGRVVFTGAVTDTERYYAAADVLVLPAVQEAFGNVVLEALAAGLPAVVSACAGAAEVLGNGLEEGLLCDPLDHRELAARVKSLLAGSVAGVYAAPARRVAESYSMTASLDRTETLFRETIREKTESRAGVAENSGAKVAF